MLLTECIGKPTVAIFTPVFLDPFKGEFDLKQCNWGGGERYLIDLCRALTDFGMEPHIWQPSMSPYKGEVFGFPFYGLGNNSRRSPHEFFHDASTKFAASIEPKYDRAIYFNIDLTTAASPQSIGVTHGIWWDQVEDLVAWRGGHYADWMAWMRRAHEQPRLIVSVDANSINWVRATYGRNVADKMRYIPNYADEAVYTEERASVPLSKRNRRTRIICSRRMVPARGVPQMLDAVEKIIPAYAQVEAWFIGKGAKSLYDRCKRLEEKTGRCHTEVVKMDGMAEHYFNSSISVVPTIAAEGTSLSCIESMAAGCAVVATRVGGLSNLVIDGHNGLLIEPTAVAIERAIRHLLDNPAEAQRMATTARQVFLSSFTITQWRARWHELLKELGWI